jgi:hypothetical protein
VKGPNSPFETISLEEYAISPVEASSMVKPSIWMMFFDPKTATFMVCGV